ncbi:hypothetical protein SELMODRAFT_430863 [Selaginella moellendorffii]|uniref:ATPase domain-containing protein n=1 Tax=Selaginella moellendorffii TaxID=88036 RepID=D8TAR9_SELML|nr:hypothetical protein SELMODRAFT_430863 [Selaginella moellendorffii]
MRSGTFNTAASFGRELKAQALYSFVPAARKFLEKPMNSTEGKASMESGKAEDEADEADEEEAGAGFIKQLFKDLDAIEKVEGTDMQELLKALESLFAGWTWLARLVPRGQGGYPTLIIDEANRLHEWSLSESEEENLMTLQAWLIMVTKQMGVTNVILCSSEDFFKFWVEAHFGKDRYMVGVVGDLTEEESFKFFKWLLKDRDVPPGIWKEIYDYFGGRINSLKHIARQLSWCRNDEAEMQATWEKARRFMQAKSWAEIAKGMQPENLPQKWTRPVLGIPFAEDRLKGVSPLWTPDEFKLLLKRLTDAEGGVCSINDLRQVIRKEALFSLIQHNFLHYREESLFGGRDLDWFKGRFPIVMPVSRPKFHAMKQVLSDYK